ncbi:type II secretion system protein N [Marinovum sp.]|uniref:type II secretion system protein N n=1 Tax=Marinovum sp. TaxID=2024839 RepID=UPI002B266244|nr:type II secretion system protein N [Marinovum sp.]
MTARQLWALTVLAFAATLASLAWQAEERGWLRLARVSTLPPDILRPLDTGRAAAPDLGAIHAFAPFGRPDRVVAQGDTPEKPAPTKVNFVLRGVLAFDDAKVSRAFIYNGTTTDTYHLGDSIEEGVVLVDVRAASVILEIDGIEHELGFDGFIRDDPAVAQADLPLPGPDQAVPADSPLDRLAAALTVGRGSLDLRQAPPETVDDYISKWRGRIQADPAEVMETIGLERTDRGYRIKPDPDIGVTLAGLQPGDIVTRLNGQEVGNIDRDRELYDQVAAAGVARLEVERSGETLLMTFSLR